MSYISTNSLFSKLDFEKALDTILWNLPERLRFLFAAVMSECVDPDTPMSIYLGALMDPFCCLMARFYKQTEDTMRRMVAFLQEHKFDNLKVGAPKGLSRFLMFTNQERIKQLVNEFAVIRAQLHPYWVLLAKQNKVKTKTFVCLLKMAEVTHLFRAKSKLGTILQLLYDQIVKPVLKLPNPTWVQILAPPTPPAISALVAPLCLDLAPQVAKKRTLSESQPFEQNEWADLEPPPKRPKLRVVYLVTSTKPRKVELSEIELYTPPPSPVS